MLQMSDMTTSGCRTHTKVFNGEYLPTDPIRWFWVCTTCQEAGSERRVAEPELNPVSYWRIMRKIHTCCWVPAKYRDKL